jgi:23S rRNA pseudouridine2605 synthase
MASPLNINFNHPDFNSETPVNRNPDGDSQVLNSEKLHKVLARIGYGSRRTCELIIEQKRVEVNGVLAVVGARVDVKNDVVKVDGKVVGVRPDLVYYLLNKPPGFISSVADPQGRPTVINLVPNETRVYPIGRLDLDSEGLLILTNDGELTNLITHPSHGVEKEYLVSLHRDISEKAINRLRNGVLLEDGITAPAKVTKLSSNLIRISIHEGRNRQVRRMCDELGYKVLRLIRIRIGPIRDSRLRQGEWRMLEHSEVINLREAATVSE